MKYQRFFSGKEIISKNSVINLSSGEYAQRVIKIKVSRKDFLH